jgi:hypothetical protein
MILSPWIEIAPEKSSSKDLIGYIAKSTGTGMTWKPSKAASLRSSISARRQACPSADAIVRAETEPRCESTCVAEPTENWADLGKDNSCLIAIGFSVENNAAQSSR